MRHDEPEVETSDSILPDLLSALLNQWDGAVAEPPIEIEITAEPAPLLPETNLRQTRLWQIPIEAEPIMDAPAHGFETLLAQLDQQYLGNATEVIPEPAPEEFETDTFDTGERLRFIQFSMAEESFAVPIGQVVESGRLTDLAPLPCVNDAIRGLINLHGEIVPLLDLRSLLGSIHPDHAVDEKLLIVRTGNSDGNCGLAVDRVSGILALKPSEFENGYCHRKGSLVRLLDLERLFDHLSGKVATPTLPIHDQPGRS